MEKGRKDEDVCRAGVVLSAWWFVSHVIQPGHALLKQSLVQVRGRGQARHRSPILNRGCLCQLPSSTSPRGCLLYAPHSARLAHISRSLSPITKAEFSQSESLSPWGCAVFGDFSSQNGLQQTVDCFPLQPGRNGEVPSLRKIRELESPSFNPKALNRTVTGSAYLA